MKTTVLDKVLIENRLYQKNGLVFSLGIKPNYLGKISEVIPKLLEKQTKKENED